MDCFARRLVSTERQKVILHNLCFPFLLGIRVDPRETEDDAYEKFWGANKVYKGDVEMANSC